MPFRRFNRSLLPILLSLLLLVAQQAAYAHLVGHLGSGTPTAIQQEEGHHGAALSLSHTCTTCIALAAFAVASPPATIVSVPLIQGIDVLPAAVTAVPRHVVAAAYRARAPPVVS